VLFGTTTTSPYAGPVIWWQVLLAAFFAALALRIGFFVIRNFANPLPPPPPPGELRRVRLTYRCSVCGAEVRMTAATNEDPEPPRHCMEEMELQNPED
jgi:hypothetical protein